MKKHKKFKDIQNYLFINKWIILSIIINIAFIGGVMNMAAIKFNHNHMPFLSYYNSEEGYYWGYTDIHQARLWFLSDIFKVAGYIISIGDFILFTCFLMIVLLIINSIYVNWRRYYGKWI